jgi:hypothetical protein
MLEATRFAQALLDGIDGAPKKGTELHRVCFSWVARQLEAWERHIREDERANKPTPKRRQDGQEK